jgi:thiamine-phosphate pyrophosphorylase
VTSFPSPPPDIGRGADSRRVPTPPVQLITGPWRDHTDLLRRVEAALRGGIRWVQLRAKERSARELHEAALGLAPLLREAGALFVVNDRVDVALASGADGVHLPEDGMPALHARRLLGKRAWIGRSVHSIAAVGAGAGNGADAVQFGPVFPTASKRAFGPPQGLAALCNAAREAHRAGVVLIGVGGIDLDGFAACIAHQADAVAIIGSLWGAADIEGEAGEWTRRWSRVATQGVDTSR